MDPKTLKYTPTHEWVHLDGDVATVGISQVRRRPVHRPDHDRPAHGRRQADARARAFGEVESVKAVSDLYAPVGGEVVEVNDAVADDVQILAEDPYTKGWLVKVKVADPAAVAAPARPRRLPDQGRRRGPLSRDPPRASGAGRFPDRPPIAADRSGAGIRRRRPSRPTRSARSRGPRPRGRIGSNHGLYREHAGRRARHARRDRARLARPALRHDPARVPAPTAPWRSPRPSASWS